MHLKYYIKIVLIIYLFICFILFINSVFYLNTFFKIEGYTKIPVNSTILNKNDAFCESHRGASQVLEKSCGKLTQNNCNSTSCCVWTSDNTCLAGNIKGPTFNSDTNGKTKKWDTYYFQNKCYGAKCVS